MQVDLEIQVNYISSTQYQKSILKYIIYLIIYGVRVCVIVIVIVIVFMIVIMCVCVCVCMQNN